MTVSLHLNAIVAETRMNAAFWKLIEGIGVVDISACRWCSQSASKSGTASAGSLASTARSIDSAVHGCEHCNGTGKDPRPFFSHNEEQEGQQLDECERETLLAEAIQLCVAAGFNWSGQARDLHQQLASERPKGEAQHLHTCHTQ